MKNEKSIYNVYTSDYNVENKFGNSNSNNINDNNNNENGMNDLEKLNQKILQKQELLK